MYIYEGVRTVLKFIFLRDAYFSTYDYDYHFIICFYILNTISQVGMNRIQKNLFFRALKKNPFHEKFILSKTQKILNFEKKSLCIFVDKLGFFQGCNISYSLYK